MMAYVVPVLIFLGIAFGISNKGNMFAAFKIAAAVLLILLIGVVLELIGGQVPSMEKYSVELLYTVSADSKAGGGVLAGLSLICSIISWEWSARCSLLLCWQSFAW